MTNDKMNFIPTCPVCGATDHKRYRYKGSEIIACPQIRGDSIYSYGYEDLKVVGKSAIKNWSAMNEWDKKQTDEGDKYYCGLEPLETGEQDPYWRDGVCKQHDERFIKHSRSTWIVTRDFAIGATKTMLRGLWAVVGYPAYLLIGGLGGAIRYATKKVDKHDSPDGD